MKRRNSPPRVGPWLLKKTVPARLLETVLGDLQEEFRNRPGMLPSAVGIAVRMTWQRCWCRAAPAQSTETPRKGDGTMATLWNDLRFGFRVLAKAPGFTAVALLTLALGIGANTAIFSVVNAVLLKPLPLPDSDRLVQAYGLDAEGGQARFISWPDFLDWQAQAKTFESMSAFAGQSVNLTGRAEHTRVRGAFVSDNFFKLVKVEPVLGRGFIPGRDDQMGAPLVCVVQHETWQGLFGGDPKLLGSSLILNNQPYTVVGILPPGFRFPYDEIEVWMPHHAWPVFQASQRGRDSGLVGPIGRLKPGVGAARGRIISQLLTWSAR